MTERRHYSLEQLGMAIRPAQEADYGLVYDSMIESYHKGSPEAKCVRMGAFKRYLRELLDRAVSPASTIVVCSKEEPSVIYGWALMDGKRLVYLYTQQLWRSKGVAQSMLDFLQPDSYACWTFAFRDKARKMGLDFVPLFIKPI